MSKGDVGGSKDKQTPWHAWRTVSTNLPFEDNAEIMMQCKETEPRKRRSAWVRSLRIREGTITMKAGMEWKNRRTAVHFRKVCDLCKGVCVAQGHEDHAMVGERADCVLDRHFLPAAGASGRHERASVLAHERARHPQTRRRVPERLRELHQPHHSREELQRQRAFHCPGKFP